MEASCSLGESSYEVLQDILSSTSNDITSIQPSHSITSKDEFYTKIVFDRDQDITKLCGPCLNSLLDITIDTDKEYGRQSHLYSSATRHFSCSNSLNEDLGDDETVQDLISDVLTAEEEIVRLLVEENAHSLQLEALLQDLVHIENDIYQSSCSFNSVELLAQDSEDSLVDILSLAATTEIELEHLTTNLTPLFSFQWMNVSTDAAGHGLTKQILLVNGLRLAFAPLSSENLNWAEICAAWSCVGTAIVCYQNANRLIAAAGEADDGQAAHLYTFRIVCLRNCVVLVGNGGEPSGALGATTNTVQQRSYKLLCSEHSRPVINLTDCLTNHRERSTSTVGVEYMNALVALAIVLLETMVFCHLSEKLNEKPALSQLLAMVSVGNTGGDDTQDDIAMRRLIWPHTSTIISHMYTSRTACVQLTNELLSVVVTMMTT